MKILVAAIEMETDLEKYYLKQAKINKGNELEQIFTMLANDEKEHASILRSKLEEIDYSLEDSKSLQETKDLFKNMEDFNLDIKELPSQLDSLRFALDMEKKSIDAYKKMQTESDNEDAKEVFEFLIRQEKKHFEIIEELIFHQRSVYYKYIIRRGDLMIIVEGVGKIFERARQEEVSKKRRKKKIKAKKEEFYAVNDVSFEARGGEIVGIIGPNGAGKTTLLRMLGGILTPSEGSIKVNNYDHINNTKEIKKRIGFLSGNTKLYGRITPRELLYIFGQLYEMNKEDIEVRTKEIFTILGMEGFADNRIENLSTGQTQRTSIARCLIHSPDIYIFDEPTLGLDVMSSQDIIEFMKSEREKGKIVLYSTHYMEEAETLCDNILMIHEGKVIGSGTSEELKTITNTDNLREAFLSIVQGGSNEKTNC